MNQNEDEQYLKLLSIFHYVVGGLAGLFACFPLIHFSIGIGMLYTSFTNPSQAGPLPIFGFLLTFIAGGIMLLGWTFAICIMLAGKFIIQRKNYMFCLVMAGVECIFTPFGTVLGAFTIILLMRPAVKEFFGIQQVKVVG
jgi:hypothetical protein